VGNEAETASAGCQCGVAAYRSKPFCTSLLLKRLSMSVLRSMSLLSVLAGCPDYLDTILREVLDSVDRP